MPSRRFSVTVIADRCKECGICIALCPKNVLEKGKELNWKGFHFTVPARPEQCIGCRLCEYNCPDFAIFVVEAESAKGETVWARQT